MKMEHYLSHTDYPIWQVIQNGNGPVYVTTNTNGIIKVLPLKTIKEVVARERERKSRTTLLMALPEDHLAKFHKKADAKETWEAIQSRFGEGMHKGYDMFQTLLSQLEIHGASVSHEDANQKFLRSLPSSWSQVDLIMRTKPGLDTLSFDDLYNNLRVFERDVKGTTASSSNIQNVAFVYVENTSSTNDVSTAYSVSSLLMMMIWKNGFKMAGGHDFHKDKEVSQEDRKKVAGHFARDCRAKRNKMAEEEMLGTMETKLEIMVEDMHIKMTQKLWLPLMEKILNGLDMLRKMLKTVL
nr:ribonuclease H-like domain-containing protein [Tanacetum cinerariifolium]